MSLPTYLKYLIAYGWEPGEQNRLYVEGFLNGTRLELRDVCSRAFQLQFPGDAREQQDQPRQSPECVLLFRHLTVQLTVRRTFSIVSLTRSKSGKSLVRR